MNPENVDLVQRSFKQVTLTLRAAGSLFYKNLFAIAPELRPLFKGDLDEQGRKLMETLATMVSLLKHPDKLVPTVKDLGERHAAYGVEKEHFAPVGAAPIATLRQGLGKDFTDEGHAAWLELYQVASQLMTEGLSMARQSPAVALHPFPTAVTQGPRPARYARWRGWWKSFLGPKS